MAITNVGPGAAVVQPSPYYGYPTVGAPRRIKPTILAVIHTTETTGVPIPSASHSWTFSVERDGTVHQFLDPVTQTPWTNGDIKSPDTSNPLIAAIAGQSQYNPNEYCFLTIENVNRIFAGERLTDAQLAANHRLIEWGAKLSGLPVDRAHVIGHYQINGETRVNCPTVPTDRDRVFAGVLGTGLPDTATEGDVSNYLVGAEVIVNRRAALNPGSSGRSTPTFNPRDYDGNLVLHLADDKGSSAPALLRVQGSNITLADGSVYDARNEWIVTHNSSRGLLFWHIRDVAGLYPIEAADCTAVIAERDAAKTQLADANTRYKTLWTEAATHSSNVSLSEATWKAHLDKVK